MKIKQFLFVALGLCALTACHKDSPGKKIVDGLPISTAPLSVPPAEATQQYLLLNNTALNVVITNLNRLNNDFPVSGMGPDGAGNYSFRRSEKHYGTATFTAQFQDINGSPIDPFQMALATASVKYVHITITSASTAFNSSANLLLILDTVGVLAGPYHMTGTSQFDGSSYSIIYTIDPNGVRATIDGLLRGAASSINGPNSHETTSSSLSFGTVGDVSGTLHWQDQTAGIQIASNGSGSLTTSDSRILFQ